MRAVTLDLWQTLIHEGPVRVAEGRRRDGRARGVATALAAAGEPRPHEAIVNALRRSREAYDDDHDSGVDRSFVDRVRQMLDFIEPGLSRRLTDEALARVVEGVDLPFLASPPVPDPAADRMMEELGRLGVELALISNTGFTSAALYRRWMSDLGWLRWLRVTTFSNEAEVAKPSPDIFLRTLAALGVGPSDAIHVGDSLWHDIAGARGAGMASAWMSHGAPQTGGVEPDYVITSLDELPAVVRRWLAR